jgi:hypothetical protein
MHVLTARTSIHSLTVLAHMLLKRCQARDGQGLVYITLHIVLPLGRVSIYRVCPCVRVYLSHLPRDPFNFGQTFVVNLQGRHVQREMPLETRAVVGLPQLSRLILVPTAHSPGGPGMGRVLLKD